MNPLAWYRSKVWRSEKSWFWIRQVFHFLGGIGIGLFTHLLRDWWFSCILFILLMGAIIVKEIFEDQRSQGRWKTIVDCLAWCSGFWLAAWPKLLQ